MVAEIGKNDGEIMDNQQMTTIWISQKIKSRLGALKLVKQEPYYAVIERLLDSKKSRSKSIDK